MVYIRKITRNPHIEPTPKVRAVIDTHLTHPDCLFDAVKIPALHQEAWLRALRWLPKTEGWAHTFDLALVALLEGSRPLLYGWLDHQIAAAATAHNLETLDLEWIKVAFFPKNRDIAELLQWSHKQPPEVQHVVNGVALGYPLAAVETWVRMGCPGAPMEEMLRDAGRI